MMTESRMSTKTNWTQPSGSGFSNPDQFYVLKLNQSTGVVVLRFWCGSDGLVFCPAGVSLVRAGSQTGTLRLGVAEVSVQRGRTEGSALVDAQRDRILGPGEGWFLHRLVFGPAPSGPVLIRCDVFRCWRGTGRPSGTRLWL